MSDHHLPLQVDMPENGRVALVTGAAGGIGYALCEAYARQGHEVWMSDVNEVKLAERKAALKKVLPEARVRLFAADLQQPAQIEALFQAVEAAAGRLDVLVNNAGMGIAKTPDELAVEEWDTVLNTNLRGAFLCARAAASLMRRQEHGGRIINIASTRALMSEPNSEAYAASKGGLVALTHALAASYSQDGITVNCISPGWIETGEWEALRARDHAQHWTGRVGKPEDIAAACLYLSAPGNGFVNGVNLVIDGGMTRKMIYEP